MLRLSYFVLALLLLGLAALAACDTGTTTTGVTPLTGVIIRSDDLVRGIGCGTRSDQVFKYVAVATRKLPNDAGLDPAPEATFRALFDCFADGYFVNLPASTTGNQEYQVTVDAFNAADYARQQVVIAAAVANGTVSTGGVLVESGGSPDATTGDNPSAAQATWTTTCTATQQANIAVLAVCPPLAFVGTTPPDLDAATDAPSDAPGDATPDAPADAGTDAPADAIADAAGDAAG